MAHFGAFQEGRVGKRPPWKKIGWAWPTLEILAMVWKLPGNSLSMKVKWWAIKFSPHSVGTSVLQWAGWATVTYGRVSKLKTRVCKPKKNFQHFTPNFIKQIKCLPTLAWNNAGAPGAFWVLFLHTAVIWNCTDCGTLLRCFPYPLEEGSWEVAVPPPRKF